MYFDIVIPDKNEKEFIDIAKKLGYNAICFLYNNTKQDLSKIKSISSDRVKVYSGFYADKINKAIIKSNKQNAKKSIFDFSASISPENPREIIEKRLSNIIFSLESQPGYDFLHQRNSGFNHILAKLAEKNNISIGFSLSSMLDKRKRHEIMGRIMQNIMLCKKYNVNIVIASLAEEPYQMKAPKELISLFSELNLNPKQAKQALSYLGNIIEINKKTKNNILFGNSVEIVEEKSINS